MANLPPSPPVNGDMQEAEKLVQDLINPDLREEAFLELSKKRETFQDLAPLIWNSFGIMAVILQEVLAVYPALSPPVLTSTQSNHICHVLSILQCVASHPETKMSFLNAKILMYLYPFMRTTSNLRQFEYLRLTSLGVIGALVKVPAPEVINDLISSEMMPFCLTIMETGSELSKSVATFIIHKILANDTGLNYVCSTTDRFFALARALGIMVTYLATHPSLRLLKHIVQCYLRLSDNPIARDALVNCLPIMLRDNTFANCLREDPGTRTWLNQLLMNLHGQPRGMVQTGGRLGFHHGFV